MTNTIETVVDAWAEFTKAPNDKNLGTTVIVAAGIYEMTIKNVTKTTIKAGAHAGKPALNLILANERGWKLWKLIPMWEAPDDLSDEAVRTRNWMRMSRKALVDALGTTNQVLFKKPESLVGSVVKAKVSVNSSEQYGERNEIKGFVN